MPEKRKDNKGRNLLQGELQRKDGKYEFRYYDAKGVRHSIYSWKLVDTDRVPEGKKCSESLRSMEKRIRRDGEDGIETYSASHISLNQLFDSYMETKRNLKESTRTNYFTMYDNHVRETIGYRKISTIKYSDVLKFYEYLIHDKGFKPNSMEIFHTILHPVFSLAVRDGLLRDNPTKDAMKEIKSSYDWESPKRHALTVDQQNRFVEYVAQSKKYHHWLSLFTVMLGTGCRIGEVVGLRWEDCDFEENMLSINHQLVYRKYRNEQCAFHITTPKTKAGVREIPMFQEVRKAILEERLQQMLYGFCRMEVDGYSGFIFHNRFGECLSPHCVNRAIERIVNDCNQEERARVRREGDVPVLLPHFSAHHLRHTFCTRLCEHEQNLKVIQEIMGHAHIETTMNIYNEATKEQKVSSFANLEGKIRIC